jgi:threonine 3-dehydrogenase
MRAIIKAREGLGNVELVDRPIPEINENQVLIKIKKAGICGTDFHVYKWDKWSQERIKTPLVMGHEFAGEIVEMGKNVTGLHVGQRVSAEGHITCGICKLCRTGRGHICDDVKIIGVDRDGCFAEYLQMPAYNVWPLDDDIEDKYGAIMDPLGNAMNTVMAQPISSRDVLITGGGSIGLFATAICHKFGASRLVVSEPQPFKADIARRAGADVVINPLGDDPLGQIREAFNGKQPEVVLEMSGFPSALQLGLEAIEKGGDMAVLGIPPADVEIDMGKYVIFKGITVRGINGRRMFDTWFQCQNFLKANASFIDQIITHEIPMEDINEGFKLMAANKAVKVVLTF